MNNILQELAGATNIGIAGHIRPDGDCTGSCMALYNYLITNCDGANVDVYLEYVPEAFRSLKNTDQVKSNYDNDIIYDVFISLDCGATDRLGQAIRYFEQAKRSINIDHHISNTDFGDSNHVRKDASSTCEVLFGLFEEEKITKPVAEALYTGIIHDTGVFKHTNTTESTMIIASKLINKGIDFSKIIDESFYQKTYIQNQILGRCLLESILVLDGKCIVSRVTQKILDFYGAGSDDLDGIIDQLRVTKGVEAAILIHETGFHEYKVSMRSNGIINVCSIATYFGGGGHIKAAGCTMKGSMHDAVNNLTKHIESQLLAYESSQEMTEQI